MPAQICLKRLHGRANDIHTFKEICLIWIYFLELPELSPSTGVLREGEEERQQILILVLEQAISCLSGDFSGELKPFPREIS